MKKVIFLLVLSLTLFKGFSQSSEKISKLLESSAVTNAQASYLAAVYLNLVSEDAGDEEAFASLAEHKYFKAGDKESDLITFGTISYVYAKALKVSGGFFYTVFPSKRYAFNELKAKGIIPAEADPSEKVSGTASLAIFTACEELAGGSK